MSTYHQEISNVLQILERSETAQIKIIAGLAAKTIDAGGLLFVFGSGHSSILAEEAFHRAGGLIPIYPILYSFLSPHTSPKIAGPLERMEGIAPVLFARSGAGKGDLLFIASNSGVNAAAVDMALAAKKSGVTIVALTSLSHSQHVPAKHSSGSKLFELADYVIDNHCPPGDALVTVGAAKVAAGSTIANAWIWNSLVVEVARLLQAQGKTLPVYMSANLPGGEAHNEVQEKTYRARIPLL